MWLSLLNSSLAAEFDHPCPQHLEDMLQQGNSSKVQPHRFLHPILQLWDISLNVETGAGVLGFFNLMRERHIFLFH